MKNFNIFRSISLYILLIVSAIQLPAQQWIKEMPGYERYNEIAPQIRNSVKSGAISVNWAENGKSFDYYHNRKKYRFDIKKRKTYLIEEDGVEESPMERYRRMY